MALGAMGFELAISVAVGTWLGLRFDEWKGSSPLGLLVGILTGLLGALYRLYAFLRLMDRHSDTRSEG